MEEKTAKQSFWELVRFAVIALVIVIPIRLFIAEPFVVSGASMVPAFSDGDYLIVDKISYRLNNPQRYDVIIFVYSDLNPKNEKKFFIKRIVGLPNEIVNIKGNDVTIINEEHEDGFKLEQPFVKNIADNTTHFELKKDEYFVMGDNRPASSDSRYWGAIKRKHISGKAFLRLLPIKNMDIWPGSYKQSADSALGSI